MTDLEKQWLDEHFPLGYVITVVQPRNVLTVLWNPEDKEGLDLMFKCVGKASDIINAGGIPSVHDILAGDD